MIFRVAQQLEGVALFSCAWFVCTRTNLGMSPLILFRNEYRFYFCVFCSWILSYNGQKWKQREIKTLQKQVKNYIFDNLKEAKNIKFAYKFMIFYCVLDISIVHHISWFGTCKSHRMDVRKVGKWGFRVWKNEEKMEPV